MISKMNAYKLYLALQFMMGLSFGMIFVVASLYEATVAHLSGLQLVLVGTTLELTVLLFEVPTGVVADAYPRAIGQVVSGPVAAAVSLASIRAAISMAALLLAPALPLIGRANRLHADQSPPAAQTSPAD
jgi:DHA3 family tetracycline resistance protein-like MFS transporter